jgi:TAT (twin-arginine translocation) pathway signal sequence
MPFTRREFLVSGAALAAAPALPSPIALADDSGRVQGLNARR